MVKLKIFFLNVIITLLMIIGILIILGYFDKDKVFEYSEPMIINNIPSYAITIHMTSKIGFISNEPIDFNVQIRKFGEGEKFVTGESQFWISRSCSVYSYPLNKSGSDMYEGGMIGLSIIDDGNKLSGHDTIIFLSSGNCEDSLLRYQTKTGDYAYEPNFKINIEAGSVSQNIKLTRLSLILTLITIYITLIGIINFKKEIISFFALIVRGKQEPEKKK